jgi:hypothetical protein
LAAAHDTEQKATSLRRQRWSYDLLPVLFLAICIGSALYLQRVLKFEVASTEGTNLLQTFEAVLNIAVFWRHSPRLFAQPATAAEAA